MAVSLGVFFSPLVEGRTFSTVANLQQSVYPWAVPGVAPDEPLSALLDQADYVYPRQVFLDRALKSDGKVPLWNPLSFGGQPFFSASGSRIAYPPLLHLTMLAGPSWTHDLYTIFHLFVAGIGAFALMRSFKVGLGGALLTGVAWMFSSYTLSWITLEMFAAPAALLPIGLLCVRRWYDRDSWPSLLLGAFVMGLLFLGTTVELALFCFVCVGAYAGSLAVVRLIRGWRDLTPRRRVGVLAAPPVLGLAALGVAAVGLLPFLELSDSSDRAERSPWTVEDSSVDLSVFRHALTPPPVPEDVFEAALVLVSAEVFVGTATALLAVVGLFARRPGSGLGAGLAIGVFLFAVGTPVTSLALAVVPRLDSLGGFGRTFFLWDLSVAVLGGLGLDALLRWLRSRRSGARHARQRSLLTVSAGAVAAVCIIVTGTQLVLHGRNVNPSFQARDEAQLYPSTPAIDAARTALGPKLGRSRVIPVMLPGEATVVPASVGMALDLPSAGGYETVLPKTVTKFSRVLAGEPVESALSTMTDKTFLPLYFSNFVRTDLLGRAGIAAVIGPPNITRDSGWAPAVVASRGLRQTYAGTDGTVYEVLGHQPRATVVTDAVWTGSSSDALRRFVDPSFDSRRQVILEGDPPRRPPPGTPAAAGAARVEWREDRPDHLRLRVTAEEPGWLVLLDTWDPGWKATVNGQTTDVIRANYNFRAVAVPAGSSTVEFSYRPPALAFGASVSALSTGAIACAMVPGWARANRAARRGRRRSLAERPPVATDGSTGDLHRGVGPGAGPASAADGGHRPRRLGEVDVVDAVAGPLA